MSETFAVSQERRHYLRHITADGVKALTLKTLSETASLGPLQRWLIDQKPSTKKAYGRLAEQIQECVFTSMRVQVLVAALSGRVSTEFLATATEVEDNLLTGLRSCGAISGKELTSFGRAIALSFSRY